MTMFCQFITSPPLPVVDRNTASPKALPANTVKSVRKSYFKKKIEMCKNILLGKDCPFGDKCVFAHDKSELQLTKLKERHDAGLLNADTFRTRPCFDHVATGSCPFGDRCTSIHDTSVDGRCPAWLPRINNLNALQTDYHIDWNSSYNFQLVHYGTPFGQASQEVFSSYDSFRETICNLHHSSRHNLSPRQRLEIAIDMTTATGINSTSTSSSHKDSPMKYKPAHFIFGKLCMIAQAKAYDTANDQVQQIPMDKVDQYNPKHVTVHELIFGHNLSDDDMAPSLWFNVPPAEIAACTHKEQLRYNRKKARAKDILHNKGEDADQNAASKPQDAGDEDRPVIIKFATGDEAFRHHHENVEPAFPVFYPGDDSLSTLISATMRLQLDSFRHGDTFSFTYTHTVANTNTITDPPTGGDESIDILYRESALRQDFEAVKSHFVMSYWPVNMDRQFVTSDTLVPEANGTYKVREDGIHRKLWQAFVCGLNEPAEQTRAQTQPLPSVSHHFMASSNESRKRLGVFESLAASSGVTNASGMRGEETKESDIHVPLICSPRERKLTKDDAIDIAPLDNDFDEKWELIKNFYKNRL